MIIALVLLYTVANAFGGSPQSSDCKCPKGAENAFKPVGLNRQSIMQNTRSETMINYGIDRIQHHSGKQTVKLGKYLEKEGMKKLAKYAVKGLKVASNFMGPVAGGCLGAVVDIFGPDPNEERFKAVEQSVCCLTDAVKKIRQEVYNNKIAIDKNTGDIAFNRAAIVSLEQDLNELQQRSDANDKSHQAQLNSMKKHFQQLTHNGWNQLLDEIKLYGNLMLHCLEVVNTNKKNQSWRNQGTTYVTWMYKNCKPDDFNNLGRWMIALKTLHFKLVKMISDRVSESDVYEPSYSTFVANIIVEYVVYTDLFFTAMQSRGGMRFNGVGITIAFQLTDWLKKLAYQISPRLTDKEGYEKKTVQIGGWRRGAGERCNRGRWLDKYPWSLYDCQKLVEADSTCSNTYYSWANYGDRNCWCVPVGYNCEGNLVRHDPVSTWKVIIKGSGTKEAGEMWMSIRNIVYEKANAFWMAGKLASANLWKSNYQGLTSAFGKAEWYETKGCAVPNTVEVKILLNKKNFHGTNDFESRTNLIGCRCIGDACGAGHSYGSICCPNHKQVCCIYRGKHVCTYSEESCACDYGGIVMAHRKAHKEKCPSRSKYIGGGIPGARWSEQALADVANENVCDDDKLQRLHEMLYTKANIVLSEVTLDEETTATFCDGLYDALHDEHEFFGDNCVVPGIKKSLVSLQMICEDSIRERVENEVDERWPSCVYTEDLCEKSFLGNGFCDPNCNNHACGYDGGDCVKLNKLNAELRAKKLKGESSDSAEVGKQEVSTDNHKSKFSWLWLILCALVLANAGLVLYFRRKRAAEESGIALLSVE